MFSLYIISFLSNMNKHLMFQSSHNAQGPTPSAFTFLWVFLQASLNYKAPWYQSNLLDTFLGQRCGEPEK